MMSIRREDCRSNNMEHKKWKYPTRLPASIPALHRSRESLSSRNYKPETLKNYRYLLRRFGRLLEAEDIAPSALTPDLAVELGRRLPTTPKSQIKIPNLARLFVAHLIEIGVATRPPLTPAQAERAELMNNFETYLTILNPDSSQPAAVTATFFDQAGNVLGNDTIVIDPLRRGNIKVNDFVRSSGIATILSANIPVVADLDLPVDSQTDTGPCL